MKRLWFCLLSTCALHLCAQAAKAHVLDQYLQAAQLAFTPEGVTVELRLTPGKEVAEYVFALLDANRDGELSDVEAKSYAERVRQDLVLTSNTHRLTLLLTEADFTTRQAMTDGTGTMRLTFFCEADLRVTGGHQLEFQNYHLPQLSAYLVNALVPATRAITITGQKRDVLQREFRLDYRVAPSTDSLAKRWLLLLTITLLLTALLARRKIYDHLRNRLSARTHKTQLYFYEK